MSRASESSNLSSSCRVGSSNLSTSKPRDFKSLVSRDGFESRPVVAGMKALCLSPQGFETPRGHYTRKR